MYMNILIYGYGHLTSSILSQYPSEQIRLPLSPGASLCLIGITRVGSSEADPTKNRKIFGFIIYQHPSSKQSSRKHSGATRARSRIHFSLDQLRWIQL